MVSVGDAETGGYRDLWREKWCQWVTPRLVAIQKLMGREMVSEGDETGGYRDLWREKWCQRVPRLVATETYGGRNGVRG